MVSAATSQAAGPCDPLADREALEALAEHCGRFSPGVAVAESDMSNSLLLDVTGLAHLFGGEAALAEKIVNDFASRRLTVRMAVADTIGAAWAVARYQGAGGRGQDLKFLRETHGLRFGGSASGGKPQAAVSGLQIAHCELTIEDSGPEVLNSEPRTLNPHPPLSPTAHCRPSAACYWRVLTIVPCGETLAALRPLPVAALRLAEETVGLLHQLGIDRIGQMEALPRDSLSSRFGPQLLRRWDQATGRQPEVMPTHRPTPPFQADWSADHPTTRRETVEAVFQQLIARLAAMLKRSGRGAMRLECRLDCISDGTMRAKPVTIMVGLFEPTASAEHLFQLARMQLERLRIASPVSAIRVAATDTAPLVCRQQELFALDDGLPQSSSRQLAALVDRLSNRLGRRSVVRAQLVSDAQPELSWRSKPLLGDSRRRRRLRKAASDLPPRPLRLLPRPLALDATSIAANGPPLRFRCHGREHQIAHTWGPQRIETGWWRGHTVARDYYQIETTTGHRYWLFRRLRDGRWFVHGMFE